MYILSPQALRLIDDQRPAIISKLALTLNCSEGTINRNLRDNENTPDNDLTKAAALKVISEETGLDFSEILEEQLQHQDKVA